MQDTKKLTDNVWLLGTELFNQYLVTGNSQSALIEAGVTATSERTAAQLDALGIEPDWIIVTHPHADHLTGLPALEHRFPGARVVVGPGAREFAQHPRAALGLVAEDVYSQSQMKVRGMKVDGPALTASPDLYRCEVVTDQTLLELGGVSLQLLHTGGHSPGNLTVYCPERSALFVSDSLGFRYADGTLMPLFFAGLTAHRATLDRLEALDAEIVGLGHQGALMGEEAREIFKLARRSTDALVAQIQAGREKLETMGAELYKQAYRDELSIFSPDNISTCISLMIKRALEEG